MAQGEELLAYFLAYLVMPARTYLHLAKVRVAYGKILAQETQSTTQGTVWITRQVGLLLPLLIFYF